MPRLYCGSCNTRIRNKKNKKRFNGTTLCRPCSYKLEKLSNRNNQENNSNDDQTIESMVIDTDSNSSNQESSNDMICDEVETTVNEPFVQPENSFTNTDLNERVLKIEESVLEPESTKVKLKLKRCAKLTKRQADSFLKILENFF